MPIPMRKDEYRPALSEVAQRLLENHDFVAALESFLATAIDGQAKWYPEALQTFGQLTKLFAVRAENHLTEEHIEATCE